MSSPCWSEGASVQLAPGSALVPEDFALRLTALKELADVPWEGMASLLGVDSRQLWRWRQGITPNGGALLSLVCFALQVPGGLAALTGQDVVVIRVLGGGKLPGDAATGERGQG